MTRLNNKDYKEAKKAFDREGYVVFEDVLSGNELTEYLNALQPFLKKDIKGRNNFEGHKTNRIYALLNKSEIFGNLVDHPLVMQFVRDELGESALLSALIAINLLPGESVQPWHTDDGYIGIEMPHPSFGISAFWALTDTNGENGATEVLPGSHHWSKHKLTKYIELIDSDAEGVLGGNLGHAPDTRKKVVELNEGSLMLAKGTLIHRGGANNTDRPRLIVSPQYCFGWARQIENMIASVSKTNAMKLSEEVRRLMGYSIHPPFIGYVDGVHPNKLLGNFKH
ncbi:phytanoyl-CoA dioxygenase family protein [uncultured Oceanicoccus sp.]|uniref:phytanoyl-CoA dioxygenase family protein n=1 Tax=uncultured Oceanicoccus sp. TaxID=1706381 RepID=UPI0030D7B65A